MDETSCGPTSLPAFGIVSVLDFGHSNRCVVVSQLLFFFLHCPDNIIVYDVEHLCIYLFAICLSSLVRCLLVFGPLVELLKLSMPRSPSRTVSTTRV